MIKVCPVCNKEFEAKRKDATYCSNKCCEKLYWFNNSEKKKELNKKWYAKNSEKMKELQKKWRNNNPEKIKKINNKYQNKRRQNDINYKIGCYLRTRVSTAVRIQGTKKSSTTKELLGCSIELFKQHLEKQFTQGMSWENYGKWHIDHIIPCASFDLTNPEEQKKCFNWTNLQPLWAEDNLKKGKKIINETSNFIINSSNML